MRVHVFILATTLIGVASCAKNTPVQPTVDLSGDYKVCEVDAAMVAHGNVQASHVVLGDVVQIRKAGTQGVAETCLRGLCASVGTDPNVKRLWVTVNGSRLQSVDSFDHTKEDNTHEQEPHLVKIEKVDKSKMSAEVQAKCMGTNVVYVAFCPLLEDGTDFNCGEEGGTHQGGAHIEN